jgi:O-antigen/teichoic acid export membrane protein
MKELMEKTKDKGVAFVQSHGFKKYASNTSWLFLGRVFTLVIAFFVSTYVARYLGPTNYGILSYAIGIVGLFSFIANLGIDQIIYRELIKYPEKESELLGSAMTLKFFGGLVAYALLTITTLTLDHNWFISSMVLIIGATFIFTPVQTINYYFQAKVLSKVPTIAVAIIVIILSLMKIGIVFFNKGIYYLAAVALIEPILYVIFYTYAYSRSASVRNLTYTKSTAKLLLRDSWPFMIAAAFSIIYTRIDQIMIEHMLNATAVGIYSVGENIAEVWYFVPGVIISSLFPAIVNARMSENGSYERRLFYFFILIAGVSLLFALPIHYLSGFIIAILYGSKYAGSAIILSVYVWAGIGYNVASAATNYLTAENHRLAIFMCAFAGAISNVILNLVFIPRFGIMGSAYATLISYSLIPISMLLSRTIRAHVWKIVRSVLVKA